MSHEVAVLEQREVVITNEQTDLIKRTICQGATDAEMKLFFYDCTRRGVHPLDKLIHFTKRAGKYTPITSIDFMRQRAQASGVFAGEEEPVYTFLPSGAVDTCKYVVYRLVQGQRYSWTATARWDEYYPGDQLGFMWKKMPSLMLAKCAEALALRKAFPAELQGLYVKEEMDQAGPEQKPLRTPSQILAESEKKSASEPVMGEQDGLDETIEAKRGASGSIAPASQDAAHPTDNPMVEHGNRIAKSQSTRECVDALNAMEKDTRLDLFEKTQLREEGQNKLRELKAKK
jgi:phage recombination protein Bet